MIVAVGLDLVELDRIRGALTRHPERFTRRVFHPEELAPLDGRIDKVPGLAARFAAKEAFQKCWPESFGWKDVWVIKEGPKPKLSFAPELQRVLTDAGLVAHVSLTHARQQAAAVVVLEQVATKRAGEHHG